MLKNGILSNSNHKFSYRTNIKLFVIFLISGCSTSSEKYSSAVDMGPDDVYNYVSSYSYGKNVLIAAGMHDANGIVDTPITEDDYKKYLSEIYAMPHTKSNAVLGVGAAAWESYRAVGAVSVGSVLSSDILAGLLFSGIISDIGKKHYDPNFVGHVVFWMPKEMANDIDEVKEKINIIFRQAFLKSIPDGYSIRKTTVRPTLALPYQTYEIKGGICNIEKCRSKLEELVYTSNFRHNKFSEGTRPNFFNEPGAQAWVVSINHGLVTNAPKCFLHRFEGEQKAQCNDYNQLLMDSFIKNLPEWVYHYNYDHLNHTSYVQQGGTGLVYPMVVVK